MTAKLLIHIYESSLLPSVEDLFGTRSVWILQDNDHKHTARITKQWLQDNEINCLRFPPQSPDINPIENLWKILEQRLTDRGSSNLQEMEEAICQEWMFLEPGICKTLVTSMSSRLQ